MAEPEVLLNLSVNYIPKSVDEFELRDLFKKHGSVESIKWFMDRKTGSNLGNGFVKYRTAKTAADAIKYLNGHAIGTKRLKVAYTKEAEAQQYLEEQRRCRARNEQMEYERIRESKRLKALRAEVQRKVFWPFVCNRVDCAVGVCITVEAVETVYPHAYPKDVAALTMAMLCGPLPAHAVESALSPLMESVDFTEIKAGQYAHPAKVEYSIKIFPTSGPRDSVISADHLHDIMIAAPPEYGFLKWFPFYVDWERYEYATDTESEYDKHGKAPTMRPLTLSSVKDHITRVKRDPNMDGIDMDYVIDFFTDNCIDPTHIVSSTATVESDDCCVFRIFFAGHLKSEPQQMLFAFYSFVFYLWMCED